MTNNYSSVRHLDIELKGIGDSLTHNYLFVPKYQRTYAWVEKNISELYQDITSALNSNEPEYFLGSLVVSQKIGDKGEVVDGQQRLATISIFIAAIRDYLIENGDPNRAQDIERDFLFTRDLYSQESTAKLTLNSYDNDYYLNAILSKPNDNERTYKPIRDSHFKLQSAQKIAKEHIHSIAKTERTPIDALLKLIHYISKNAKIIYVRVPDHANAFIIFETLNDRGLDLSIADLLKNYLFGKAENRIDEAQTNWNNMLGTLESIGKDDVLLTYLRHFWSSYYSTTREKYLYDEIKKKITSKIAAIDFSIKLENSSQKYAALFNPKHEFWKSFTPTTIHFLENLLQLRLEQYRPLLLAICENFEPIEVQKSLEFLVASSVRFLIVGGLSSGSIEKAYSEVAIAIRNHKIKSSVEIASNMKKHIPDDSLFQQAFSTARVSQNYLARYYLVELENYQRGKNQSELIPNLNLDEVNLEHILPENPGLHWGNIQTDQLKNNYKRIGNMTLLSSKLNSEIGNLGFAKKKEAYSNSIFELNKKLSMHENWTIEEITKRQAEFSVDAIQIWKINY